MEKYDFSGWATRNNLKCSDGRTIMKDAFKHCDGMTVPLVWGHRHDNPLRVLGHALLENREDGVYTYGAFNDTEQGRNAKQLVEHGDIVSLSIYANQLKQQNANVLHGNIREVSLVLAGANPGAFIENVIRHSEDSEEPIVIEDEATLFTGEGITLYHADNTEKKEDTKVAEETKKTEESGGKTIKDILETLNEEQTQAVYAIVGMALEDNDDDEEDDDEVEHSEGGNDTMKHNVFDQDTQTQENVLSHADQEAIINLAKQSGVGSLQAAISMYAEENKSKLAHGFVDAEGNDAIETLFPDYKLMKPGAPETIERDLSWVDHVLNAIHKSPITRIRTRQADARMAELRAKGYQKKGDEKKIAGQIKLIGRTTDPQTVYRKDEMHRDDIIDITDFDVVEYMWKIMRNNMNEELALAALIGDGREEGDPDKIHETHIRSVWNDDELYTIHADVDIAKAKADLQGSNTSANFGENYIYAEAIITAALYAREKYKGSGNLSFYCTPHLLNVMLLARDLNGRRIYSSVSDIAAALNVSSIHTIEQFEDKVRTDAEGNEKKLLGLFVNMKDYQFGCAKGGEITKFDDFDIDFNKYKYLMETRLSGTLTKLWSAIALEEPVVAVGE